MYNIDMGKAFFVERAEVFVFDVNIRFNSLKFDVEQNGEFYNLVVFDDGVRDVLLLNNVLVSMNKISIFSNAFWVMAKALQTECSLFFVRKKNKSDTYNFNLIKYLGENL